MVSKFQSVLPYAASTAASAALIVLLSESKEGFLQDLKNYSYFYLLKLALGISCFCYFFGKVCSQCRKFMIRRLLNYRKWLYAPRSQSTKVWGAMLYALIPNDPPLYSLQQYLPKYPLPTLDDTCEKTLVAFKPLLTDKEYVVFEKLVHQLRTVEGPSLQKFLEQRYREESNWLTPMWDKYAYLASRGSLAIESNFACLGDVNTYIPPNVSHCSFAANLIHYAVRYLEDMESGKVIHMRIQNFVPICCDRYKYVLQTTRVPHKGMDDLVVSEGYKHICVFRKGHMYKLNIYAENEGGKLTLLSPGEIQYQLDKLTSEVDILGTDVTNPAIFTTLKRDVWAETRETMMRDETNAASLEAIEKSLFCFAFTEKSPENFDEELSEALCGNGYDRWFDKSLCFFLHKNFRSGFSVEHATAEATLTGRMWEYVYFKSNVFDADGNACFTGHESHENVPQPELLEWKLDQFTSLISSTGKEWHERVNDLDTRVYYLTEGKETIKKLRISPDGFLQIALQLAFYRLHRVTPKTYETATTRLFLEARTETIRPFSKHSVAFTKTMDDEKVPDQEKKSHLLQAVKYQTKYKLDAMAGLGVDRHLFGLYVAGKFSGQVPEVFTIPPLCESDRLSTSQSPLRYDEKFTSLDVAREPIGGGFGPQRHDGYGLSYFFDNKNKVHLLCTSYKSHPETGSKKFTDAVQQAMDDMVALMGH